ncbi:MAG: hypothetical protein L6R41_007702 [Letrouitia leprolyta]|nr:MAG: hypothetical protein L6R41_007702 [Letrouitia leprolyta]
MLQIIELVDVPSLLSLRRVNKSLYGLITCYESSIVNYMAWNLGLTNTLEGQDKDCRPAGPNDLEHIVQLNLAHNLAIKAVASGQAYRTIGPPRMRGIPLDDPFGDEIRQKVQNGLMVISALSQIQRKTAAEFVEGSRNGPWRIKAQWFGKSKSAQEARQMENLRSYINSLSAPAMTDFVVALWCIRGKTTLDQSKKEPLWRETMEKRWDIDESRWMTSHLARSGLRIIDDLWSDNSSISSEAKSKIRADCKSKSNRTIKMESTTFSQLPGFRKDTNQPFNAYSEGTYYYVSTFAFRIGPCHNGLSDEQLRILRREIALNFAISNLGH